MNERMFDIIVIGAGSGGLSVGLTINRLGLNVLMIAKTDNEIGGDCLNNGCVASKALIHISKIVHHAKSAIAFGLSVSGAPDIRKAVDYVYSKQEIIREHENAKWLTEQGITVALGEAKFSGKNEVQVNGNPYRAKRIVIATGSKPRKLDIPGVEKVRYFDNDNIFQADDLPERILVIGAGPVGIEIAQALSRLNRKVTVVHRGNRILERDDEQVTSILLKQLIDEGIEFQLNADVERFTSANEAIIKMKDGATGNLCFDAIFVAIGRELQLASLQLQNAGIHVKDGKIEVNHQLRTTNRKVFVCGDVAGDLLFSHVAEFHARILINNFFSPLKIKSISDHLSWVTFSDPEIATFGLGENQLKDRNIRYKRVEHDFRSDDRAVIDNYRNSKLILFISRGNIFTREKIAGGTMIAPQAGELIQELILANNSKLSIKALFNKIYPYPVAARINQQAIVKHTEGRLTGNIKKLLRIAYKLFS